MGVVEQVFSHVDLAPAVDPTGAYKRSRPNTPDDDGGPPEPPAEGMGLISQPDSVLHQLHIVAACEKRLRECDEADEANPFPQNPYPNDGTVPEMYASWSPDPKEYARFVGKQAIIKDKRAEAKYKRGRALAKIRARTDSDLLADGIFAPLDVDAEYDNTYPPRIERQVHRPVEDLLRPSWMDPADWPGSYRDQPSAPTAPEAVPDKVELMNRWEAQQRSAQPQAQPQSPTPVLPPVGQLQKVAEPRGEDEDESMDDYDDDGPRFRSTGVA